MIIPVTESFVHPLETAAKIKSTALIFLNTGITIVIEGSIYPGLKMAMEEKKLLLFLNGVLFLFVEAAAIVENEIKTGKRRRNILGLEI